MLKNTKRTKIVCTLGPASEKEEVLTALIENGLKTAQERDWNKIENKIMKLYE